MKIYLKCISRSWLVALLLCGVVHAEDIDIFAGTTAASNGLPNVIFVLDNTSNWSRASQKWPGGVDQGQSEVRAIKAALAAHVPEDGTAKMNVGIMEYVTGGSSADTDAGYTRFNLQPLTTTSLGAVDSTDRNTINGVLNTIFDNINDPIEKRSSSNPYGDLPWDLYNYLRGGPHSNNGTGTPDLADSNAYTTNYSLFKSPLGDADACADTSMIFIGNNANGAVTGDDATNSDALKAAYIAAGTTAPDALAGSNTGTPLGMPGFDCTQVTTPGPLISPEIPEVTETVTVPGVSYPAQAGKVLGTSQACYKISQAAACTTAESARVGGPCNVSPGSPSIHAPAPTAGTCSCVAATTSSTSGCVTTGSPANRTYHLSITGNIAAYSDPDTTETVVTQPYVPAVYGPDEVTDVCEATDTVNTTTGRAYNFDDWAKFLNNYGVPLTVTKDDVTYTERVKVSTFVVDVFNAQQSADLSSVWFSAANAGGGRYFQAKNEQQIFDAIQFAVGDILAVSSSFSAVTLPLSTTNSSQVENKIYIGMFRPAPGKKPRWFGNLKRYRLASFFGQTELADVNLRQATNPLTGFATDCAESFWTSDSDNYWENLGIKPSPDSKCPGAITAGKQWSDLPDGPVVEKGGVAQLTREGPVGSDRKLYTVKSNALALIDSSDATALGGTPVLDYLRGDAPGVGEVMALDDLGEVLGLRPSIHGDVVHSRPLSVRYDTDTALIYYGTNDGLFRAVDADSGAEQWAFLAPEHFAKMQRLHDNAPLVYYEGAEQEVGQTYIAKEYFFDGSTGQFVVYEAPDDPQSTALGDLKVAYIFPTMRRGGRMLYGFDVTTPGDPELMWRVGCPNLANDDDCVGIGDDDFTEIGQTWSKPVGAYVAEYPGGGAEPAPVIFVGGGFDDCLNADQAAYPAACSGAKGKGVYMLNAATGALIEYFATDAPVITDAVPIDIDSDKTSDFVYVADVAGNLYRIRFADLQADLTQLTSVPPNSIVPREDSDWVIEKIASIPDTTRRFYNSPAVGLFRGTVFVAIGSGDRERPLEVNYPYAANVQNRFYVLADSPYADFAAEEQAEADGETYTRTVVNLEGDTMYEVGTEPGEDEDDGWYLDLPDRGEQVVNPAVVVGGKVFFNTFQPGGAGGSLCDLPLGIGTAYDVSLRDPQDTEGDQLAAPGFPVAPIVANVEIPVGCTAEPCEPVTTEEECAPPKKCVLEHVILGGCSDQGVCPIEPDPPPVRTRAYFTEEVDR